MTSSNRIQKQHILTWKAFGDFIWCTSLFQFQPPKAKGFFCSETESRYAPYSPDAKRCRLLYAGQVVKVNDIYLQVEATEPTGLGLVSTDTEIFANWDATPEFEKVHILPFMDRGIKKGHGVVAVGFVLVVKIGSESLGPKIQRSPNMAKLRKLISRIHCLELTSTSSLVTT